MEDLAAADGDDPGARPDFDPSSRAPKASLCLSSGGCWRDLASGRDQGVIPTGYKGVGTQEKLSI